MPMGNPEQRTSDRQSTRQSIQIILQQSEQAFLAALTLATGSGRVEDVRHACLSLALVRAFQTSLGEGSASVTASAAAVLGKSLLDENVDHLILIANQLRVLQSL